MLSSEDQFMGNIILVKEEFLYLSCGAASSAPTVVVILEDEDHV